MKAKSIKGKSAEEIKTALQQSMTDGFEPTLAIVFISVKQDRKAVCDILGNKGIEVFGATSCGEFINGRQDEGSIVILLLELNRDAFTILFEPVGVRTIKDVSTRVAEMALEKFEKPALIVCSTGLTDKGEFFDGGNLVKSLESALGKEVSFFGGMAGDDRALSATYIFTRNNETSYGIIALVLDGRKVELQGMAITGWKPVGITRTITKSKGKLLYTIDNQPAVEMYLRYLGKQGEEAVEGFNLLDDISMHYPLLLERERGEPLPLTPLSIDQTENALVCDLDIPQGRKIWFSMPPDLDISETIIGEAKNLKETTLPEADAMLIFSCAGRINVLGPLVTSENEGLYELWNVPMAGFFTYGEYGRALDRNQEFHSGACCWVALKEK
ncbi:MAG: hypothetical protein CVT92_11130 [Bacteroidetes bacterium HGW-Bacteroidetes-1]|jgi:hypothetical protein|nr:MAG: hypothetical protein CVT92_11130 [Bacteroidetes bacterium HGW-Bacteroidetes-1]